MKELRVPVETDNEIIASMTIVMDNKGLFYLNAPFARLDLCYMLHGVTLQLMIEEFRKMKSEQRIKLASIDTLNKLGGNGS